MEQNVYITNASLNMIFKSLRNKKLSLSREQLINHISSDFENEFEGTSFYDNMHFIFNNTELKEIYFAGFTSLGEIKPVKTCGYMTEMTLGFSVLLVLFLVAAVGSYCRNFFGY